MINRLKQLWKNRYVRWTIIILISFWLISYAWGVFQRVTAEYIDTDISTDGKYKIVRYKYRYYLHIPFAMPGDGGHPPGVFRLYDSKEHLLAEKEVSDLQGGGWGENCFFTIGLGNEFSWDLPPNIITRLRAKLP